MSRVIVSIMSEQTIPNYIFIKEQFQIGDELLFITSQKMENKVEWITATLGYVNCTISKIVLDVNVEERWFKMCNSIRKVLTEDKKYIVNLTGGTKYLSLSVLRVFEDFDSEFFYIPFPKNELLLLKKDNPLSLNFRANIEEYLSLYNIQNYTTKELTKSEQYATKFFLYFVNGVLDFNDFRVVDLLRSYREKGIKNIVEIESLISNDDKKPQIIGLNDFLDKIEFPQITDNALSKYEVQYLTGGWFEEYIYNKIKDEIQPQDIALGLEIRPSSHTNHNDLDVVFTLGNKLFVIECKTGIAGVKMFNETVYKATALKETLFGLPGNTFIFSLGGTDEKFEKTAKNMGITYYDRTFFVNNEKWSSIVDEIKTIAKN